VTLTMFDSVNLDEIPANPQAVAAYVDGRFANATEAAQRFPHAHLLTIAVSAAHDASCLDIETGDATPEQAPAWYQRQKARGAARPCLYASAFVMDTEVLPALRAAGIGRPAVRLWSAHYSGTPHICSPTSCRELAVTADGTQWTSNALGRDLDESLLAADFFDTPTPPATGWTAAMIADLPLVKQGDTGTNVRTVQALCTARGHVTAVDGAFGSATWISVLAVQRSVGLAQDGVVGQQTWTALVTGQHG